MMQAKKIRRGLRQGHGRANLIAAAVAVAASAMMPAAHAATDTWTGAASGAWSNAGNWTGGNAPPVNGDTVVFTGSSTNLATTNDLVSLSLAALTYNTGASAYSISG